MHKCKYSKVKFQSLFKFCFIWTKLDITWTKKKTHLNRHESVMTVEGGKLFCKLKGSILLGSDYFLKGIHDGVTVKSCNICCVSQCSCMIHRDKRSCHFSLNTFKIHVV